MTVDEKRKIKIKDKSDRVLGYVVTKDKAWKLENAEQTEELYILRRQSDGDYKLETGDDKQVYRCYTYCHWLQYYLYAQAG